MHAVPETVSSGFYTGRTAKTMHLFNLLGGHRTLWCLVALGRGAVAGLVGSRGAEDDQTYAPPLIVLLSVSIALFVCFTVKVMYMKYRRIKTVHEHRSLDHGSESLSSTSSSRRSASEGESHSGVIIGCFGSPSWETRIHSRVDNQACARLSAFSCQTHVNRKARTRWSPQARSGLGVATNSNSQVMDSTSRLGSIGGPQNAFAMSSMLRPPQTAPFDGEGMRKTVHLVPRVLSRSGDYHLAAETNNTDEDIDAIDQGSPRSSIRLISRPPGDLPHTLYGPLGISQLSPILGTTDSVLLSKTPFEFNCKPLPRPPLPPKHWTSDALTPGQPYDLASVSAYLPGSQFLPLTTLNSAVRSVILEREHATCELASEKWNTRPRSRKARFRNHPVGASPLRASLIPEEAESMSPQPIRTNDDESVPSIIATFGETFGYAVLPPSASCTPRTLCIANDQPDPTAGVGVQAMTLLPDNTSVITTDPSRDEAFIRTRVSDRPEDAFADAGPDRFCFDGKNFYEENGGWPTRSFPSPEIGVAR
ncbi:hypothetical protein F5141DRAFT_1219029 [Pisolithus sp. B1]|nr:hypothetical protein F5141DRAFT_1219029 [Pisolithus sp. B1]